MEHEDRPRWLAEPCPAWCTREHRDADHPEDRYHQSEASIVVGVQRTGPETSGRAPLELAIWIGSDVDADAEWLTLEALEHAVPRIRLTIETATALRDQLDHQLMLHKRHRRPTLPSRR